MNSFLKTIKTTGSNCRSLPFTDIFSANYSVGENVSARMQEFRKKLREKTPIGKLDEQLAKHPHEEKEPLEPWPNNTNPHTGEIGGPKGPEPTRYGDWERKGRVTDF
ncbi:succinate dehydrogenase assembly factor 4, mitochondrial-like [Sitophilus oryzae]|uniref:Succinate dehydrogenase assembly factor 4, mitochondrial n=1 Tax=Sitophilus oryzae TaxID=7048 RepID=A0A6J2YN34_SITOR|nr:succinate dehydrogenase assembly factor 4, mitochondrial-like [Sitophilus oryzae]